MKIFPIIHPTWSHNIWRAGEEKFLLEHDYFPYTNVHEEADVVFTRPVAELIKHQDLDRIKAQEAFLNKPIINSIDNLLLLSSKEQAFDLWKANGVPCPDYIEITSLEQLNIKLTERPCCLRMNNLAGMAQSFFFSKPLASVKTYDHLRLACEQRKKTRPDTRLLCVDLIKNQSDEHLLFRTFMVGKTAINSYAYGGKWKIANDRYFIDLDPDYFIRHNQILCEKLPNILPVLYRAMEAVNCDIGAIDYILTEQGPVLLEINPFWGMGFMAFPFNPVLQKRVREEREQLIKIIPNVYDRMDLDSFWRSFYSAFEQLANTLIKDSNGSH